jgi:hypothetical protein
MGVQKYYKKRFPKNRVENLFKKIDNKIPNQFFLDFFYHVFGRFSVRGVQKHEKKTRKNLTSPVLFWPPRNQPTTWGSVTFFLSAPWRTAKARPPPHQRRAHAAGSGGAGLGKARPIGFRRSNYKIARAAVETIYVCC